MNGYKLVCLIVAEVLVTILYWVLTINETRSSKHATKNLQIELLQNFCIMCAEDKTKLREFHKSYLKDNTVENRCIDNREKLFIRDNFEANQTHRALMKSNNSAFNEDFYQGVSNCSWLHKYLNNNFYNSETEKKFPLAYTLVVHNSPEQVLRLIRTLYRKQNSFCIHCDAKSPFTKLFEGVSNCFDNIVVPPNLTKVVWGHSSILEAQMKCARELATLRTKQDHKWKYLINLCGKEIPLATNREIVHTLQKFSGTSNINVRIISAKETEFHNRFVYPVKFDNDKVKIYFDKTKRLHSPLFTVQPHYKSSGYHALSFPFVHHLLTNDTAISIRELFSQCKSPEEHFYATVFMTAGVPGSYTSTKQKIYFSMVNSFWVPPSKCSGKVVHRVCIVGAGDLRRVLNYSRGHFFHNKYFMENDDTVIACMEKRLKERNWKEFKIDCSKQC